MKIKKIVFIIIFSLFALLLLTTKSNASLYLNNLDFDAQINVDGSMDVTETWDITISDTNTLYKTFKIDKSRYSNITDVKVTCDGIGNLSKYDSWEYHLPEHYYYGGMNNDGKFEICWGTGLEYSSATRIYRISYKVIDAIAKYNDIAELYWQFVGEDFEIDAAKITGKIKLPATANSKEDIKVWGHVETLNGEIYATSEDTVEFTLNNFKNGRFVEVRVAFPTNLVESSGRTYEKEALTSIIEEETKWAESANRRRINQERMKKIVGALIVIAFIAVMAFLIVQAIKYIKKLAQTKKLLPTEDWEYFRELPNENYTPGDAIFLYNQGVTNSYNFGNIFSATLMDLALKEYFKIEVEKNEKGKEQIWISGPLKMLEGLQQDEEKIAEFVKKAIGNNERITIKDLQKYIKSHSESVLKLMNSTEKVILNNNKNRGNYDEIVAKQKEKYVGIAVMYFAFAIFILFIFPISICLVLNGILALLINGKLNRLTQKGLDEKTKWKGLKKYMEDFSLLNEKEIPALPVWEHFLVYATAFGIADKVIKALKMVYPEIETMDSFSSSSCIYLMSHSNFSSSFSSAISSSISSTMSSGSGGGGGFSGGGGGGRRPVAADGGR